MTPDCQRKCDYFSVASCTDVHGPKARDANPRDSPRGCTSTARPRALAARRFRVHPIGRPSGRHTGRFAPNKIGALQVRLGSWDLPVRPANSGRVDIMKRPVSWAQTSTLHDFSTTTTSTFCGMHCPGAEVWSSLKGAPERPLSPPPSRPCHPQVSPPAMRRVLLLLPRHCHRVVGIARGCASRRQSPPHRRHRPPHRRRQSPPPSPVHHCPVPSPLGGAAPPRSRPRRRHRLHR